MCEELFNRNQETIKKLELIYPENLDDLEKIVALEQAYLTNWPQMIETF